MLLAVGLVVSLLCIAIGVATGFAHSKAKFEGKRSGFAYYSATIGVLGWMGGIALSFLGFGLLVLPLMMILPAWVVTSTLVTRSLGERYVQGQRQQHAPTPVVPSTAVAPVSFVAEGSPEAAPQQSKFSRTSIMRSKNVFIFSMIVLIPVLSVGLIAVGLDPMPIVIPLFFVGFIISVVLQGWNYRAATSDKYAWQSPNRTQVHEWAQRVGLQAAPRTRLFRLNGNPKWSMPPFSHPHYAQKNLMQGVIDSVTRVEADAIVIGPYHGLPAFTAEVHLPVMDNMENPDRRTRHVAALFIGHDLTLSVASRADRNFRDYYSGWIGSPKALPTEYLDFDDEWRVYVPIDVDQQATVDALNTSLLDFLTSGQAPFTELVMEHGWLIAAVPFDRNNDPVRIRAALLKSLLTVATTVPQWHLPAEPVTATSMDNVIARVRLLAPDIAVIQQRRTPT